MLSKTLHVLADSVSSTIPLGAHLYVHTFNYLLHTLGSCRKAFSKLKNTFGLQAEHTGMPSLSPSDSPELHSIFPPEVPGGWWLTYPQNLFISGFYALSSFSCLTFPFPYQYFLCLSPVWVTYHYVTNYPKTQWLKITTLLFCPQFCRSRIPAGPHWWFSCSASTEAGQ